MKLLLLSNKYPSKGNPTYIFVQQLVCALVDLGVEITVVTPQSITHSLLRGEKILKRRSVEKTQNGAEYEIYRPYDLSFGNKFEWLTKFTEGIFQSQFSKILKRTNPDVLYGHFWHVAYRLKKSAIKNNLPLFVACGEGDDAIELLIDSLSANNLSEFVSAVTGVISVSSENKRKCIEYGLAKDENIVVLPNCVDTTTFHSMDAKALRSKLNLVDDDFLVLFVGGFISRKGANRLSAAIDMLDDPQIKSVFIGKPLAGDEALPSCNGIIFQGQKAHQELPSYLNAADVFVLPTLKEGCSNAIVEALACGTPVISSNRPFNDDILNANNSILVDPENIGEIAEAIKTLKQNKVLYKKLKEYVMLHCSEYSITERAKQVHKFILNRIANINNK